MEPINSAAAKFAVENGLPLVHVLAFLKVETDGRAFDPTNRDRPLIRWEGHYFHDRLHGRAREDAVKAGLAGIPWGTVKNPKRQAERYELLERAAVLCDCHGYDRDIAYECIGIGLGQVMGAHWRKLGYGSAEAMLTAASESIDAQFEMIARYLQEFDLLAALRDGDWDKFAHGWNGPAYRKHGYHTQLATEVAKLTPTDPELRFGSTGYAVQHLQESLTGLGYFAGAIDAKFGVGTRAAVLAFQADQGLRTDGVVGTQTWGGLRTATPRPVSVNRRAATEEDLREKGSRTILEGDRAQAGAGVLIGSGVLAGLAKAIEITEALNAQAGEFAEVAATLFAMFDNSWPILVVAFGAVVWTNIARIKAARVADHRTGKNLGR